MFAEMPNSQYASQSAIVVPNVYVMGRRIVATWLDLIPLAILIWLVDSTFGTFQNLKAVSTSVVIPYASSTSVATWPWLYLVMLLYYTVQEALLGTTIGKFFMGLKVVQNDGRPVTFIGALVRNVVRPIDATVGYLLGWVLALCSSHRRRLGDHLAGTLVVSADSVPTTLRRPYIKLGMLALLCASFVVFCLGFDYYGRPPLIIQGLANGNEPAMIFPDRGRITDLTLSQPTWHDNTVTYNLTFHAFQNGIQSNCQGDITLRWSGFIGGWGNYSSGSICNPITTP
jgi:uncharacterized RDD family membrane protein YckC